MPKPKFLGQKKVRPMSGLSSKVSTDQVIKINIIDKKKQHIPKVKSTAHDFTKASSKKHQTLVRNYSSFGSKTEPKKQIVSKLPMKCPTSKQIKKLKLDKRESLSNKSGKSRKRSS
jgi:hypothetical protein